MLFDPENNVILRDNKRRLRKHKYLKVEASLVHRPTVNVVLIAFMAFTTGVIVGFNIKDVMLKTCNIIPAMTTPREVNRLTLVNEEPKKREMFTKLPEKYLHEVKVKRPVTIYYNKALKIMQRRDEYKILAGDGPAFFLTILVKSAVKLAHRRINIRQTWGSVSDINGDSVAVVFLVGVPQTKQQQKLLQEESDLYGDIIQGDVADTYVQLPIKVLSGYQWIYEYLGNSSNFYVFTDDDCFISIPNTYDYFRNLDPAKREAVHCGFLYDSNAQRIGNMRSKWGVSEEVYAGKFYPKFCHGGMSILTFNLVRDIYRMALRTNYTGFFLEDVLISGILREKLNQGDDSIRPVRVVERTTGRRLHMMWHLGTSKDLRGAYFSIWGSTKRRLVLLPEAKVHENQFRVTLKELPTMQNKTIDETINYFIHTRRR